MENLGALSWPLPQVARVSFDRVEALNTLTSEIIDAIEEATDAAQAGGARVVIFTGAGKAFCAGAHVWYFTDPACELASDPAGTSQVGRDRAEVIPDRQ